jgi:VWFA-related protein
MFVQTILALGLCASEQQFRSTVTLVPIEVRVLDKNGEPVRDLAKADFTVRETGIRQEISHFQAVATDGAAAGRTFVLMLGRGRLNDPTKAVQALIDFVRFNLVAVDRAGVIAYRQAVAPTTDHESIATFLERYRNTHAATESLLARDRTARIIPQLIQADTRAAIDATFRLDGLNVEVLAGGDGNSASRYSDFLYLKNALQYLQTVDGDKHVIVVTEAPFPVGRVSDHLLESFWFQHATSARAALHFIHAGSLTAKSNPSMISRSGGAAGLGSALGRVAQEVVSEQTGGSSSFFQYADKSLAALDRATRFHYLIGYYPTRELPPDQYREIEVSINRPGLRLSYRRGYQAQPAIDKPEDYRQAQIAARMEDGALRLVDPTLSNLPNSDRGFKWDIHLTASMSRAVGPHSVQVAVAFDPLLTMFAKIGDRYVAELDLMLLADDEHRNVVGELKRHLKVELSAAEFAQTKRRWPTFDLVLEVTRAPTWVRGVLYQFDTDRTAMNQTKIKK